MLPRLSPGLNYLTVDPGIGGTGLALFGWNKYYTNVEILEWLSVSYSKGSWEDKIRIITEEVHRRVDLWIDYHGINEVYIELPAFHQSLTGRTVARRGDLVKLTLMAGSIFRAMNCLVGSVEYVNIMDWKGQLPKNVVRNRVIKHFPKLKNVKSTSHEIDAVGMGISLFKEETI